MSDADEKLRALAAKATPGPWRFSGAATSGTVGVDNGTFRIADTDLAGIDGAQDDAEFIAAANPVVVLSLLDRLAAVEADYENDSKTTLEELMTQPEPMDESVYDLDYWKQNYLAAVEVGQKMLTERTAERDQALQALQRERLVDVIAAPLVADPPATTCKHGKTYRHPIWNGPFGPHVSQVVEWCPGGLAADPQED